MKHQVRLPGLNRHLTRESDQAAARELLLVVFLSVVMLLPVLAYLWQNVEWIRIGYRTEKLKGQRDRLVEVQQCLRLEKASLESLSRIEKISMGQLGLGPSAPGAVVLVDPGRLEPVRGMSAARIASITTGRKQHHVNGADGTKLGTN